MGGVALAATSRYPRSQLANTIQNQAAEARAKVAKKLEEAVRAGRAAFFPSARHAATMPATWSMYDVPTSETFKLGAQWYTLSVQLANNEYAVTMSNAKSGSPVFNLKFIADTHGMSGRYAAERMAQGGSLRWFSDASAAGGYMLGAKQAAERFRARMPLLS